VARPEGYFILPLLAVLSFVAGCADPGQGDAGRCASYGWTPGTDGFAQCMQSADTQRRAILGNYLMMRAAQPPPQVPFYPMQVQQPVRLQTTCQRVGDSTFCN